MEVPASHALYERAHELNTDSFYERVEKLDGVDPELVSDLLLAVTVSEAVREEGGEALVVGGFVRDDVISRITGQPIESKDIDLEVSGLEFEKLKEILDRHGEVNIVGDHFVVAKLHNEETGHDLDCSIPRRDSKVGTGHKGFKVDGDPTMSIKEAARRRDFTMNSLAMNPLTGELHDHFGGLDDLKNGVLRATDDILFADDPLRVLRAMQFVGRFGMDIDPATMDLCRDIDITELPRERVGEEWDKLLLRAPRPSAGLEAARELGVLHKLHPDVAILDTVEQEPDWHPEGNVWEHTKLVVDAAARIIREEQLDEDDARVVMYGALCHDLGKATTTVPRRTNDGSIRLTARGHDVAGVEPASRFLDQTYQSQATIAKVIPLVKEHMFHVQDKEPSDGAIRRLARRLAPATVRLYDLVSRSDSNGRGFEWMDSTASHKVLKRAVELNVSEEPLERALEGRDIADLLGIDPSPLMGQAVALLYEAQMDGRFSNREEGLEHVQKNKDVILSEATQRTAEMQAARAEARQKRQEALERANAERRRLKQEARSEHTIDP